MTRDDRAPCTGCIVEYRGPVAILAGAPAGMLDDVLSCGSYLFLAGGSRGWRWEATRMTFALPRETANDEIRFRSGFVPRVVAHLRSRGVQVEIQEGGRDFRPLRTASGILANAPPEVAEFLEVIGRERH